MKIRHGPAAVIGSDSNTATGISGKAWKSDELESEELPCVELHLPTSDRVVIAESIALLACSFCAFQLFLYEEELLF